MADISLKFGVQGDKNMKTALAAINSEIKGLDAEMKLAVAQMSNMDSAEERNARTAAILEKQYQANAEKVSLLSKRYEDSRSKLESLGAELEEAKRTTGENSDEVQKLQNAYNKQAKATTDLNTELTKAKTKMQDAKNSMDGLGKEADETSGELDKGAKSVSTFGDTLKAKLTGEAIIAAVKKLAQGLKDIALGAVNLSDDLATQAQVTGLSTDALQEYAYMSDLVDVSVDTITGSLTKLTRNMKTAKGGTGAAAEAFESLGISITDANGELRNNQEVFDDVIDALGKMENETERDAVAMNLFGKSAQELNPLINAGSAQIRAYAKEAHDMGYVMSEDVIAKNVQASDAFARMKNSIATAKNEIGSQFAPVIEKVAETVTNLVQAARDNEDAIKKVLAIVGAAAAAFVAYEIAVSAASAATALMAANPITLLVTALAGYVALVTLTADENERLSENTQQLIDDTDAFTKKLDENKEAYDRIEEAKKNAIDSAEGEFSYYHDLADELSSIVDENGKVKDGYEDRAKVITGILKDALGVELDMTGDQIRNYQQIKDEIYKVIDAKKAEAILQAQEEAYTTAINNRMSAEMNLTTAASKRTTAERALSDNQVKIRQLENELADVIANNQHVYTDRQRTIEDEIEALKSEQGALKENVENSKANLKTAQDEVARYTYNIEQYEKNLERAHNDAFDSMSTVTYEMIQSYQNATAEEKAALDAQYGNLLTEADRQYKAAYDIGAQLIRGMNAGVNDLNAQSAAIASVTKFSNNMLAASRKTFEVRSPSRKTAEIGRYLMEGFAVGIEDEESDVIRQVRSASQSILGAFSAPQAGSLTTINGSPAIQTASGTYVIQLTLDGKQIATNTTNIQAQRQRAYAL